MRVFQKKTEFRIGVKWLAVFAFVLTAFLVYQRFLGNAYETQVVSWIGYLQESDMEQAVFLPYDENAYEAGSERMREAGYEATGKNYLRANITSFGRTFFCVTLLILCAAGGLLDFWMLKKREAETVLMIEQEKEAVYEQVSGELDFIQNEKKKMGTYMENISHQLKTPMTGIMLCLENLLSVEESAPKKAKLEGCVRQLSQMKEMTIVLLRLAQIDAGKIWMKRKRENLTQLTEDCIERIQVLAEEKEIELSAQLKEECILSCDAFWMKEAVENVLKNAVEFTPQNGVIRVSLWEYRGNYEIRIFNSGEPLDEAYREMIFERFYQREEGGRGGFGIGLHLAREIARLHQGTLKVLDADEPGTTFQFLLPMLVAKDHSRGNLTES